ncbi:hypothetical protein F5H01DRAFT_2262 [Linnemannia elongata]|nr:hypothetical protein F5H01DRAFT_2262 [Linnemannia elongata]
MQHTPLFFVFPLGFSFLPPTRPTFPLCIYIYTAEYPYCTPFIRINSVATNPEEYHLSPHLPIVHLFTSTLFLFDPFLSLQRGKAH